MNEPKKHDFTGGNMMIVKTLSFDELRKANAEPDRAHPRPSDRQHGLTARTRTAGLHDAGEGTERREMNLTIEALLDKNPCSDSREFIKSHKTLRQMWDTCERADWMLWALQQFGLLDDRTARAFAVACAEHTLHFFEHKYPEDKRPREAIEFAKTMIDNPSAAESAARSAAESAAWSAAWSAARSAAWSAARSAASSAAWSAAESAAWSAARSAAWSVAWSAAESAARSAAWSAENQWQADNLRSLIDPFKKRAS